MLGKLTKVVIISCSGNLNIGNEGNHFVGINETYESGISLQGVDYLPLEEARKMYEDVDVEIIENLDDHGICPACAYPHFSDKGPEKFLKEQFPNYRGKVKPADLKLPDK